MVADRARYDDLRTDYQQELDDPSRWTATSSKVSVRGQPGGVSSPDNFCPREPSVPIADQYRQHLEERLTDKISQWVNWFERLPPEQREAVTRSLQREPPKGGFFVSMQIDNMQPPGGHRGESLDNAIRMPSHLRSDEVAAWIKSEMSDAIGRFADQIQGAPSLTRLDVSFGLREGTGDPVLTPGEFLDPATARPVMGRVPGIFVPVPIGMTGPNWQWRAYPPGEIAGVAPPAKSSELSALESRFGGASAAPENDSRVIATKAQLEGYIENLEEDLNSSGDDAQLANVDLQNVLQKQQQVMQMMSNISKMLHDTALAIVRKIGG
jgi:hypothetical protein